MATSVPWSVVADRLAPSRSFWLVTTLASGAPHVAPVWGVVHRDALYLYTERHTVKARNLVRDPRCVVHLESGDDVVIVHGVAHDCGAPADHPDVSTALDAKYVDPVDRPYLPSADPAFDVLYRIEPARAMLWQMADWETSQLRYP